MSSDSNAADAVDHAASSAVDNRERRLRDELREHIKRAGSLLSQDDPQAYYSVAVAIHNELYPTLCEYTGGTIWEFEAALDDGADFDFDALAAFAQDGEAWEEERQRLARAFGTPGVPSASEQRRVERALKAISAVAANEGVVLEEYAARVDAVGFSTKLGENYQDREMDIGDPVRLVSERSGALKSLYTGGTGNGKSVALEREAEDYYCRNFEDGRDFKIIDPAGLRDGENWFYDVPLQDGSLQHAREELELPKHFLEADREHEIEILVPLTEDLTQQELPFDVDADAFTVQPFTIPASDIRKSLLVSILTAKLTPEQESVIRDAYSEVNDRQTDWAILDLVEEIRSRDELKASKKKPPIRTLRQLQNQGFVRTGDCDYAIDWADIFKSTDRYTVFSQSFLEDSIAELIVFGYLAHTIVKKRQSLYDIPECVVLMRELWKVAPHQRRQEFDERAAQLQEAIGHMLSRLFRDNRHSGVHVLADTQQPSDLLKPVREMFNRYVVFQTNQNITQDIFDWTSNDKWRSFYETLTPKPGEASIVGMVEPAVENRRIQFVGPVKYAPASHHHKLDKGVDANGWRARMKYFSPAETCPECGSDAIERGETAHLVTCPDCGEIFEGLSGGRTEELRRPADVGVDWPFELPTSLLISQQSDGRDRADPAISPVAAFAERCLQFEPGAGIPRTLVKQAFNEWVVNHDDIDRDEGWDFGERSVEQRFGRRLNKAFDGELDRGYVGDEYAYRNARFTSVGVDLVEDVPQDAHPDA